MRTPKVQTTFVPPLPKLAEPQSVSILYVSYSNVGDTLVNFPDAERNPGGFCISLDDMERIVSIAKAGHVRGDK